MTELSKSKTTLKYRPDIDGLRCVAVLSVLAFHLFDTRIPGGFVGVDVFFVISGYLISAIVFSEVAASRFSVVGFYERRIRRIFPALFGMLIGVSVVLSFLLLPNEFVTYANSLIAASTSASNFYFWLHSSYFDNPRSNPLLHTWSLAVEEQFYILFPLFLVVARRFFPQRLKTAVVALFLISLVASEFVLRRSETSAFYMPYTRAWELLLGTIVSIGYFPRLRNALLRNLVTVLGIAMIGYSVLRFDAQTPFPGLHALIPCIGSTLIIGAGESGSSVVYKALALRPVVFVGLISYSLYLWHWPIIVLNDLGLSLNLNGVIPEKWALHLLSPMGRKLLVVVLSFVLATLSWKFVEQPFRSYPRRISRRPLFALSAAVLCLLLLSSGAVIYARGFKGRFPPRAVQIASFISSSEGPAPRATTSLVDPPTGSSPGGTTKAVPKPLAVAHMQAGGTVVGQLGICPITTKNQATIFDDEECLQTDPGKKTYFLLGDSTAAALSGGLSDTIPDANILVAAVWGCKPSMHPQGNALCRQFLDFVFRKYLPSHPVQGLFLEARWFRQNLDGVGEIVDSFRAHGVKVVVFGPVVEYDAPLPRLLAYSITWNRPDLAQSHRTPYATALDSEMQNEAQSTWHACYASLYRATCEEGRCLQYADSKDSIPLMSDDVHLTALGSDVVAHRMAQLGELDCLDDKTVANGEEPDGAHHQGGPASPIAVLSAR